MEPLLLTVPEAAKVLRIGRNLAYQLIRCGQLPAIQLGRKLLVPRHALTRMLEEPARPAPGPVRTRGRRP